MGMHGQRFARALPIKRGRSEVPAPLKLGSTGARRQAQNELKKSYLISAGAGGARAQVWFENVFGKRTQNPIVN
jgi:hypothetical protein